ncbi:MAG TPA: tRNA (adenosine(37)-N6)-threonylcarbamoyltransferase complex transferase subunit TsaD [Patescibacteria group bacterium]|nr:tRNA (adenosine(37)-N6)-threonylcarbamoyltransferase complex transferase subunit TsaD [Patescibacteria group bacterium]
MKILSIETSCDETSAAIIEKDKNNNLKIISNIIASSSEMHALTDGVIPENAAREQIKSIIPVIEEAMKNHSSKDIDAIAVTVGPGLIGSLLVGVETAKTLSMLWNKPLIPVNHLLGHIYANFIDNSPQFPLLALVVSGGHTDLVLMKSHDNIKLIGSTRDDAAGEAFDKTARLLNLPYPGGPNLSKLAGKFIDKNPDVKLNFFPRPMINENNFDWSFSGLKTAVLREVQKEKNIDKEKLAAEVQEAIVDSLVIKTMHAAEKYKVNSLLIGGGVSANSRLRSKFSEECLRHSGKFKDLRLYVPEVVLCTDNAAAIGAAAFFQNKKVSWENVSANPELIITDLI